MSGSLVTLERTDAGVRVLTLNDPDHRNAIGPQLRDELIETAAEVGRDADARVLIVRGAGPAFCAGANLGALLQSTDRSVSDLRDDLTGVYESFFCIRRLGLLTIAAVHGAAVGAGLNLVLACDVRFLSPEAYLHPNFAGIGLHPGGGATWLLTQALGRARAVELLLRARRIPAAEAVTLGLANAVVDDPCQAALEFAEVVCSRDPQLVTDLRSTVNAADGESLESNVRTESWAQAASVQRSKGLLTGRLADRAKPRAPA